jgi:hypothetical protein
MSSGRPWSKLQKEIYNLLLTKELDLQIHTTTYPVREGRKGKGEKKGMPRYWISLDKNIVWDWPTMFKEDFDYYLLYGWIRDEDNKLIKYSKGGTVFSGILEEYVHTPKDELRTKIFDADRWGFTEILKASDRRFGKKTLETFKEEFKSEVALKIIDTRLIIDLQD